MADRRRRTVLTVLVLVSLVLVTLDYRVEGTGPVATLKRGAATVFEPLQNGLATVVRPIGGFFSSVGDLGGLRDQNADLTEALDQARTDLVSQADLETRIADLEAELAMRDELSLTTTGARVIATPPNAQGYTVTIDAGADDQVAPGMAVVNAEGLVGRVEAVTATAARVLLATSPDFGVVVRVAQTGEQGLLSGRGGQPFSLTLNDQEAEVPEEAELVSETFAGSSMPDGIPVGVVTGDVTAPRLRSVQPYVDFSRLSTVQVVIDAPLQPVQLPEDQIVEGPLDAPGERPDPPPGDDEDPSPAGTSDSSEDPDGDPDVDPDGDPTEDEAAG